MLYPAHPLSRLDLLAILALAIDKPLREIVQPLLLLGLALVRVEVLVLGIGPSEALLAGVGRGRDLKGKRSGVCQGRQQRLRLRRRTRLPANRRPFIFWAQTKGVSLYIHRPQLHPLPTRMHA